MTDCGPRYTRLNGLPPACRLLRAWASEPPSPAARGGNAMKSGAWAVAAVLAATFTGAASADDGYYRGRRGSYGYEYGYGYGYDTFRIGLDKGYEEGLREGRRDGERRRDYHFSDDRRFRNGD